MAANQAEQKAMLVQLLDGSKNSLWHQSAQLDMQKIQEHRQSITNPDGNDTWRHADQVCCGDIWQGGPAIWKNLAAQVSMRITSKGQLPAECDLRRGQYVAVKKFLQKHNKLCTTRVQWDGISEGTQSGEGSPADTQASKSPKDAQGNEKNQDMNVDSQGAEGNQSPESAKDPQEWPEEPGDQTPYKKKGGMYDFVCGQVLMATPYGQRMLVQYGIKAEDTRQALGFSPEFMACCFREAFQAQPLNKNFEPFQNKEDYETRMHAMVARDTIPRLGDGWMIWAREELRYLDGLVADQAKDQRDVRRKMASEVTRP